MGFDEAAYGTVLHREYAKFKYSRLPNIKYEYILTTWGLVLRGGEKGDGDPTLWESIKNPNTHEGDRFWKFDFAGTTCLDIITQTMAPNEHFPGMSTEMARMFNKAWHVALMFKDNLEYREKALIIWSQKHKYDERGVGKDVYVREIHEQRIDDIFRGRWKYKKAATEMLDRGKLKTSDFQETDWEIKQKVKKYIEEKEKEEREETEPEAVMPSEQESWKDSVKVPTPSRVNTTNKSKTKYRARNENDKFSR